MPSEAFSCATLLSYAAKRLPVAMLGVRYKGKQKIEITRPMLRQVVQNFRKRDTGEVPIDYDHSIETAAGSGGPVPAAGWIKSLDDEPDAQGILWGSVEWTSKAVAMIKSKEYKYISPVLDPSVRDNRTGADQGWTLTSAALTNQPVLQGMPPLVLSESGGVKRSAEDSMEFKNTGYSDDWNPAELEITRRTNELIASRQVGMQGMIGYAEAEQTVISQNPDLVRASLDAIAVETNRRIKQLQVNRPELNYQSALQQVFIDDSTLGLLYQTRTRQQLSLGKSSYYQTEMEIGGLAAQKMRDGLSYPTAYKEVLSERPDLAQRRNRVRGIIS